MSQAVTVRIPNHPAYGHTWGDVEVRQAVGQVASVRAGEGHHGIEDFVRVGHARVVDSRLDGDWVVLDLDVDHEQAALVLRRHDHLRVDGPDGPALAGVGYEQRDTGIVLREFFPQASPRASRVSVRCGACRHGEHLACARGACECTCRQHDGGKE
jgi:hypothetical protein